MAGFLEPLLVREIPGDDTHWQLAEPCVYFLKSPDGHEWVEAEVGYITDFGSIPRLIQVIPGLSSNGRYRRAYVIHDKLFTSAVVQTPNGTRPCSFEEANDLLNEAMGALGANRFLRWVVERGVSSRVGHGIWNRYRRQALRQTT